MAHHIWILVPIVVAVALLRHLFIVLSTVLLNLDAWLFKRNRHDLNWAAFGQIYALLVINLDFFLRKDFLLREFPAFRKTLFMLFHLINGDNLTFL